MVDFISTYFINPIITGEGYNTINTITYAIVFLLAMYGSKLFFDKLKIEINEKWFKSIVLIAVVGGLLRAMEDWVVNNYGVLPTHFIFTTPGIYILLSLIVALVAYVDNETFNEKMGKLNKTLIGILGFFILAMMLTTSIHNVLNITGILIIVGILVKLVMDVMLKKELAKPVDMWVILGHTLDGVTTSAILTTIPGYFEQHVVTRSLLGINPWLFPVVKIAIAISVVYIINRYMDDEPEWANITRLFITIIGLGPGTRDMVRVLLGV